MASRYHFALATGADDAELRTLIRRVPMGGPVRIAFQREPSFFAAERVGALSVDVIAGRDRTAGRIVGFGSRSTRRLFVNGAPARVAYLSSLRSLPEIRGGTLLARGYRALRELHTEPPPPYCVTTILDDNPAAKRLLTSRRAGLPVYKEIGGLRTYAITPASCTPARASGRLTVARGSRATLGRILDFINRNNAQFQFAPCHRPEDFEPGGLFPDFNPEHFYTASLNGALLGVAAAWDQGRFKQTAITGYSGAFSCVRPFYNLYASLTDRPRLPDIGEPLRFFYLSFVAVDSSAPDAFPALLERICMEMKGRGHDYLLIGVGERHPLRAALDTLRSRVITSRVYAVSWPEFGPAAAELDGRPPHLEIATL